MSEFVDPVRAIQSIGPFHRHPVIMNGWTIPHLEAIETSQGVTLTLDHRFDLDLNEQTEPGAVIWFVANAIAVAKGYACHPVKDGWAERGSSESSVKSKVALDAFGSLQLLIIQSSH